MLRFVVSRGHAYTLTDVARRPLRVRVVEYERLLGARRLRRATTVFTDLDRLSPWDRERAAAVALDLRSARVPVLNDPARVRTRAALLRALHEAGINDFNVYRVEEGLRPVRYPVFLRRDAGHQRPLSDLLPDWDAARRAVDEALDAGVPRSQLLIVEYAGEPVRSGIFRKLSVFRVGGRLVPHLCGHSDRWFVKRGKRGPIPEDLYDEELRILRENPYAKHLERAFEVAEIDYGRADFGLVEGRVQVYEINTNPHVRAPQPHRVPVRAESRRLAWELLREALAALDRDAPGGWGRVPLRDSRLSRPPA